MNLAADGSGYGDERESKNKDADERGKPGGLWTRSHEGRDRRRRAFINIRSPHVKGRSRDLERKAHQHHRSACKQEGRILRGGQTTRDLGNVGSARNTGGGRGGSVS